MQFQKLSGSENARNWISPDAAGRINLEKKKESRKDIYVNGEKYNMMFK